jgi:hypothetical protein
MACAVLCEPLQVPIHDVRQFAHPGEQPEVVERVLVETRGDCVEGCTQQDQRAGSIGIGQGLVYHLPPMRRRWSEVGCRSLCTPIPFHE